MKKALQMTLAGTLFTIEEDAFGRLQGYLDSIKAYFGTVPDSQDVVDDIEARIAEQLSDAIKDHNNIVTITDVESVILSMGSVEEITGAAAEPETQAGAASKDKTEEDAPRKLYRNGDDMVIAGVASGMAAYLNMDPLIMRIIFAVLTIITSGGFILIYLALALFVPKAVTAADKIKMRGGPVTLSSFKESFDEQVQNVRANGADMVSSQSALRRWTEKTFRFFGKAVRILLKIVIKLTGALLILIPIAVAMALILLATNLIFNVDSPLIGFSLAQVIAGPLYYLLVLFGFLTLFIPAIFVISLGASILTGRMQMGTGAAMTLGGIWVVSVIVAGTIAFRYIPDVHQRILSLPEYQEVSETMELERFDELDLEGAGRVTLVKGEQYSVTVSGRQTNVDSTDVAVDDGTLSVNHQPTGRSCLLCFNGGRVDIVVTAPDFKSVEASGNVYVVSENVSGQDLAIDLNDASSADLTVNVSELRVDLDDASRLTVEGSAGSLNVTQSAASRFDGSDLEAGNARIETRDSSRAIVQANITLEIDASDASEVSYDTPFEPIIKTEDAAFVENLNAPRNEGSE